MCRWRWRERWRCRRLEGTNAAVGAIGGEGTLREFGAGPTVVAFAVV